MENLIIILSMLLNIALIIALSVYMKRFNDEKKEREEKTNECTLAVKEQERLKKDRDNLYEDIKKCNRNYDILKENTSIEINQQNESIKEYISKCDRQNAEIESLQSINNTLLSDNRKLAEELQEIKNKPFDPISELDKLIPTKTTAKGNYDVHTTKANPKHKTKNGIKNNNPDKKDFRNNV